MILNFIEKNKNKIILHEMSVQILKHLASSKKNEIEPSKFYIVINENNICSINDCKNHSITNDFIGKVTYTKSGIKKEEKFKITYKININTIKKTMSSWNTFSCHGSNCRNYFYYEKKLFGIEAIYDFSNPNIFTDESIIREENPNKNSHSWYFNWCTSCWGNLFERPIHELIEIYYANGKTEGLFLRDLPENMESIEIID